MHAAIDADRGEKFRVIVRDVVDGVVVVGLDEGSRDNIGDRRRLC